METNSKVINRLGIIFLAMSLLNVSCNNKQYDSAIQAENIVLESAEHMNVYEDVEDSSTETPKTYSIPDLNLKVIKNGNCRMKVASIEEATRIAKRIADSYKGYIAEEQFSNTNYNKENRFTIRIPNTHFDQVLDQICELAEFVDHKNVSTRDVSEEFIDISSRLKTKKEVKSRYETILRAKAVKVEDILNTEEKIRRIQEEIESSQGRLNYLANKVSFSTIQMSIYEAVEPKEKPSIIKVTFLDKASKGFEFGWSLIQNLVLALFYIWPLLFVIGLGWGYFKWGRK